jgi:hypothetical protein
MGQSKFTSRNDVFLPPFNVDTSGNFKGDKYEGMSIDIKSSLRFHSIRNYLVHVHKESEESC